jgi:REP element-mobilizing transposase RayT
MPRASSKNPQLSFLKSQPKRYGGELMRTRQGRKGPRPLDTRNTMHLVLRSTQATGERSFRRPQNQKKIREILQKFSLKWGVRIHHSANVGNHLHLQIKLGNRHAYQPFIRAITAAIAMAVTGMSRWKKRPEGTKRFWDYRPFTRVVIGRRAYLTVRDYIRLNEVEAAFRAPRALARIYVTELFADSS